MRIDVLEPIREGLARTIAALEAQVATASGERRAAIERQVEELRAVLAELGEFPDH